MVDHCFWIVLANPAAWTHISAPALNAIEWIEDLCSLPGNFLSDCHTRDRRNAHIALTVPDDVAVLYEVHEWRNASAVLQAAYPQEWADLLDVLREFRLLRSEIEAKGKNKSPIAARIDSRFYARQWIEKSFDIEIRVDGAVRKTPTHSVDCLKAGVALELEWNNKDPFFDRDLNNFRLLFDLGAIDVGVIITRCDELQNIFNLLNKGGSYGNSTTHMSKLLPRIEGGGGGGCPILVFGIRGAAYVDDVAGRA